MVVCDKCRAGAIIHQKYSGMHLCSAHFEEDVHRKIRESIRQTGIFARPARVAVALSGGKDSSTLLYALRTLFSRRRDIEFIAIIIDERIDGNRLKTSDRARSLAEELEIPYVIVDHNEARGLTDDEIAADNITADEVRPKELAPTPCSLRNITRERLLCRAALDLKADALAQGHNLDDEALAVLQNYLKGDIKGLFRLKHGVHRPGMVPIIKPLRRVPEKETALYAMEHGIYPFVLEGRACEEDLMYSEVQKLLNDFEARHPGTKYSLLRSLDRLLDLPHSSTLQGKSL
jgi:tRNA(Ile)-lysidine synthase TilS/MesJ